MEGEDADEIERLDEAIAELDDDESEDAALRASELLFDRAALVEEAEGDEPAVRWYVAGARRLWRADVSDGTAEEVVEQLAWAVGRIATRDAGVVSALEQITGEPVEDGRPLAPLEDLRRRYVRPDVAGVRHIEALLDALTARALGELGEEAAAVDRYGRVIRALEDEDGSEFRSLLARAMACRAGLLDDLGRDGEAAALMRSIVERFDPDEDTEVEAFVEYASTWLAEEPGRRLLEHGRELMGRIGRAAEAEAAFRDALAAGNADASLLLGWLLVDLPGRRPEGEAALRDALDPRNQPYTVAAAAFRLGRLADLRGDRDEARRLFTLAAEQAEEEYTAVARANLGILAAQDGDRVTAERELRPWVVELFQQRDVEPEGLEERITRLHVTLNGTPVTRRVLRRHRRVVAEVRRWYRGLVWASPPARLVGRLLR